MRLQNFWYPPVLAWLTMSFGQTILLINGAVYFPRWLLSDLDGPAYLFNALIAAVGIAMLASALTFGRFADRQNNLGTVLNRLFIAILVGSLGLIAIANTSTRLSNSVWMATIFFGITLFALELSTICLNSMLRSHFNRQHVGILSALASGSSWFGALVGLLLTYPSVNGDAPFLGKGSSAAFAPATFAYIIIVLPAIYVISRFKQMPPGKQPVGILLSRQPIKYEEVSAIIVCFLMLQSIYVLQTNSPLYLTFVADLPESKQAILIGFILLGAIFGAAILAALRRSQLLSLTILICVAASLLAICAGVLAVAPRSIKLIACLFFLAGFAVGALEALLREYFSGIMYSKGAAEWFSIYGVIHRLAMIVGALTMIMSIASSGTISKALRAGFAIQTFILTVAMILLMTRRRGPFRDVQRR